MHEDDRQNPTWDIMWELDTQRWKRRASDDEEIKSVQKELDKWGAFLNFLYCSSYATILVPIFIRWFRSEQTQGYWWKVSVFGSFILIFALISEWRETNREFWASKCYHNAKRCKKPKNLFTQKSEEEKVDRS